MADPGGMDSARNLLAELEAVYDTAPIGLCVIDAAGRFVRINARLAEINGVPPAEHVGRTIREVVPAIAGPAEALLRRVLDTGEAVLGVEITGETPAQPGVLRSWIEDWSPLRDEAGRVRAVNVVAREVTEERAAARALRAGEDRLAAVLDALPIGVALIDTAGRLIVANREMRRFVPEVIPLRDAVRRDRWHGCHPDGRRIEPADYPGARALRGEAVVPGIEFLCDLAEGGTAWTRVAAVPLRDEAGQVTGAVTVVSDIGAEKAAAERQALLAREVNHRATNALTVVLAALRLTPRHDADAYARAVEGRVAALARAHTLLAEGAWQDAALRPLLEAELAAFRPAAEKPSEGAGRPVPSVALDGPALRLKPAAAQAVAMALHELATNAVKHGALSETDGSVGVIWRVDEGAGLLRLRWEENGGPQVPGAPARRGFGSRVIEATVRDQLGGEVTRSWLPQGLVCDLALPLRRVLAGMDAAPG
jgi:PAS domain S-box-containing protein